MHTWACATCLCCHSRRFGDVRNGRNGRNVLAGPVSLTVGHFDSPFGDRSPNADSPEVYFNQPGCSGWSGYPAAGHSEASKVKRDEIGPTKLKIN
ncbi:hypothetical protein BJX76DRAFT_320137 [Aspergillus varians]